MAKFAIFRAGVEAGFTWLVVVAVVSSMIAAFFYIRVIVTMFMEDEPADLALVDVPATTGTSVGIAAAAAAVVVLGIVPGVLIDLARQAASLAS
jgi:NADH-quinone oxidoreductase subunit N